MKILQKSLAALTLVGALTLLSSPADAQYRVRGKVSFGSRCYSGPTVSYSYYGGRSYRGYRRVAYCSTPRYYRRGYYRSPRRFYCR